MGTNKRFRLILTGSLFTLLFGLFSTGQAAGQPFGTGVFGANVPYGSLTSLAISTDGDVTINVVPSGGGTLGTANNVVTVTSTDVVGYKLYISSSGSTNMTNGSATLAASSNSTPGTLSTNTWGYNIDGSSNFTGMTASNVLIRSRTGPYGAGDNTTVTYGVVVDNSKPSGAYTTTVIYTAVPQTE